MSATVRTLSAEQRRGLLAQRRRRGLHPFAVLALVLAALLVALTVALMLAASPAHADEAQAPYTSQDVYAAISDASAATGVPESLLWSVVDCEDPRLDPYAIGDGGTSYGIAQLHQGGGELPRFYAEGFSDVFSPYEAALFLATEIQAGRGRAWSCYP